MINSWISAIYTPLIIITIVVFNISVWSLQRQDGPTTMLTTLVLFVNIVIIAIILYIINGN